MANMVLGVGYHQDEHETVRREWQRHNIEFEFAHSTEEAMLHLRQEEYVCVAILADRFNEVRLNEIRGEKELPIILLSQNTNVLQRKESLQKGIAEIVLNARQCQEAMESGKNAMEYYLELPVKSAKPITIATINDMFFCLERRIVEVCGQRINLTPKEFDILALLITHPGWVYTFDVILESVWNEAYVDNSRKTIINHVSSLRSKLKTQPHLPNYIASVYGIGYKFDAG